MSITSTMRARPSALPALVACLSLLAGTPAIAGDPPQQPPAGVTTTPALGAPLADNALEALRGGDDTDDVAAIVSIDGTVEGNSASHVISGDNSVQGGAFGNAAGINTLIQNTGSNVLIQNGMSVNVQFADPAGP